MIWSPQPKCWKNWIHVLASSSWHLEWMLVLSDHCKLELNSDPLSIFSVLAMLVLSLILFGFWIRFFNSLGKAKFYENLTVGNLGTMTKGTIFSLLIAYQLEQCSKDISHKTEWRGVSAFFKVCVTLTLCSHDALPFERHTLHSPVEDSRWLFCDSIETA